MLTPEYNAQVKDALFTTPERPFAGDDEYETGSKGKSSVLDLLVPVIVLIAVDVYKRQGAHPHWREFAVHHTHKL